MLSYTAEVANLSMSGAILTFNPFGSVSRIFKASFSLLVLISPNINFELFQISSWNSSYSFCSWYSAVSSKFTFPAGSNAKVTCWFQWINYGFSTFNYLQFETSCYLGINSPNVNYLVCPSYDGLPQTISGFKFNVLVASFQEKFPDVSMQFEFFIISYDVVPTLANSTNLNMDYDSFGSVVSDYNCILGIRYIYYTSAFDPLLEFTQLSGSLLQHFYGARQTYIFSPICVSKCLGDGIVALSINSYTCYRCEGRQIRSVLTYGCIVCDDYVNSCSKC